MTVSQLDTIFGRNSILEALRSGAPIRKIMVLRGSKGGAIDQILQAAARSGVPVVEVSREVFDHLQGGAKAQGIAAEVVKQPEATLRTVLDGAAKRAEPGFLLILDEIEDPHNLGALIRTAECAGVHGVILPKHHAAHVTPAVVKASAGATAHIPVVQVTNIVRTLKELKEQGFWIVGLDAQGRRSFTDLDYSTPTALIVGNEGRGMRRLVREHCDHLVRIPLYGEITSLNASVAGALVMYEVTRARRTRERSS